MKKLMLLASAVMLILAAGCGNKEKADSEQNTKVETNQESSHHEMDHTGTGNVPNTLQVAADPTYPVGSEAIVQADHMEGMKGAVATIAGAYETTAYEVTYTPVDGGKKVPNHKWVIQEEIKDAGDQPLADGTEVTIEADHMKGMKGAKGVIDSSVKTTVYMIDYTPTTGGEPVTNHKWVTEDELSAK
ncbi:YdhK family protein [Sporosarcina sp. Te-1]|uniref:YdhK family protein n=1 Tax=Sporosarcina sp. Te-1 TaxID=2818390 RepID=UPI001AA008F9|nr:YdhK family protein [Sporosarcina sp. Te-1]QTD43175.1 YdhK family protein [Sporosarcina sp. Te-1]